MTQTLSWIPAGGQFNHIVYYKEKYGQGEVKKVLSSDDTPVL